jgi:DNA polymerase (family 10)
MPLGMALPLADDLVAGLRRLPEVRRAEAAGSVRRRKDTIGDIDILVTSPKPAKVMATFVALPQAAEVLEHGETKAAIRHREGIQVDLRVVETECFGAALVYFTGSKQHNIRIREMAVKRGLKMSEYGVFREKTGRRVAGATEEDVYAAIGLPWIPPELREDAGEIEAAQRGTLPRLLELEDIRGDLHCHTRASDGHHSIEALVRAAAARGYEYVGVTDHSRAATVAGGLSVEALLAHTDRIRAVQKKFPNITVLAGVECDILPDGSLDYPDEVLARLDLVVGAVHSRFKQSRAEMTRRICAALGNPRVSVLAHPTGRLHGERAPCDIDLDRILKTAREHDTAVEINCHPRRLDLNDVHARRARELGVLVAVDTDTHALDQLATMSLGVATARRAWIEKSGVLNARSAKQLLAWLAADRGRGRAGT